MEPGLTNVNPVNAGSKINFIFDGYIEIQAEISSAFRCIRHFISYRNLARTVFVNAAINYTQTPKSC